MKLLTSWKDYLTTGRVRLALGHGVELDTDNITNGVSARVFGAKGDGVTDDTAALQAWLDAPDAHKYLPAGDYVITSPLSVGHAGDVIMGAGRIVAAAVIRPMIDVNAEGVTIGGEVIVDGADLAEIGVATTFPGLSISCREVRNMLALAADARGIDVNTTGRFYLARHTVVRNISAPGNTDINDMNGISRGLVLACDGQPVEMATINGDFRDIGGEGAAAVYVVRGYDPANVNADSKVVLGDVLVHNSSRRAVKLHAPRAILNNVTVSADAGFTGPNAGAAVDIMGSHNVRVGNLTVTTGYYKHNISMTGTDAQPSVGHTIARATLHGNGVDPVIYGDQLDGFSIEDVTARNGGQVISLGRSSNGVVDHITDIGGNAAVAVVNVNSTNTNVIVGQVKTTTPGKVLVVNPNAWVTLPIPASGSVVDPANTGSIKVKRVGDKVTIWFDRLMVTGGTTLGWILPNALPLGYRPISPIIPTIAANSGTTESISMTAMHRVAIGENDIHYNGYAYSPSVAFGASPTNNSRIMHGSIVYETADPTP